MGSRRFACFNEAGFLLVEVLLVILLCLSLLSVVGGLALMPRMNATALGYSDASYLAQEELERLRRQPPSFWRGISYPYVFSEEKCYRNNREYSRTGTAVEHDTSNELVQVTIAVAWEQNEQKYSLQYQTFFLKEPW